MIFPRVNGAAGGGISGPATTLSFINEDTCLVAWRGAARRGGGAEGLGWAQYVCEWRGQSAYTTHKDGRRAAIGWTGHHTASPRPIPLSPGACCYCREDDVFAHCWDMFTARGLYSMSAAWGNHGGGWLATWPKRAGIWKRFEVSVAVTTLFVDCCGAIASG